MRRLVTAILSATLLAASLTGVTTPASASTTTTFGPLSPTNDPSVNLTGTVTFDGPSFTLETVLQATEFKDFCVTAEVRLTGTSLPPPPPDSACGNLAITSTEILTMTQPPETVDVRICSGQGATLDESTCTPWTRVFTGDPVLPTEPREWGPVKAKRGLATAHGLVNGSGLSAVVVDSTRSPKTCAWALATVTAVGVTTTSSLRACDGSESISWSRPGLGKATVKVCTGTKKRAARKSCRSRTLA